MHDWRFAWLNEIVDISQQKNSSLAIIFKDLFVKQNIAILFQKKT